MPRAASAESADLISALDGDHEKRTQGHATGLSKGWGGGWGQNSRRLTPLLSRPRNCRLNIAGELKFFAGVEFPRCSPSLRGRAAEREDFLLSCEISHTASVFTRSTPGERQLPGGLVPGALRTSPHGFCSWYWNASWPNLFIAQSYFVKRYGPPICDALVKGSGNFVADLIQCRLQISGWWNATSMAMTRWI
jgi:hypothetical protein